MTCFLVSPLFLIGFISTALAPVIFVFILTMASSIILTQDVFLLYLGRILGGLALGLCSAPAGVYVSEITTPEWRTTFGGGLSAAYMVGMVSVFIIGKVGWKRARLQPIGN